MDVEDHCKLSSSEELDLMLSPVLILFLPFIGLDGGNWNFRGEPGEVQVQLWQPAGPRRRQLGALLHRLERIQGLKYTMNRQSNL